MRAARRLRGWELEPSSTILVPSILWAARALRGPLRAAGLDPGRVELLLRLRLTIDLRGEGREGGTGVQLGIVLTALMAWLLGLLLTVPALVGMPLFGWSLLLQTGALWMVGFALFLQLVDQLLEPVDIASLLPHPVRDGELYAARLLQVGGYVAVLTLAIGFWPVLLSGIAYRAEPYAFVLPVAVAVSTALSGVVALAGVALGFAVLLRVFGPDRFQRVTLWIQVAFLTLAMAGGQLLRFASDGGEWVSEWVAQEPAVLGVLPPVQQAGLVELLTGTVSPRNVGLAVAAVLVPALSLGVALRLASRHFVAGLSGQLGAGRGRGRWPSGLLEREGGWLRLDRAQRAGHGLLAALMLRDRVLVRASIPQAIGFAVMFLAMAANFALDGGGGIGGAPAWILLGALYIPAFIGVILSQTTQYGSQPEVYAYLESLPVRDPRRFLGGALRASLVGLFLPIQALVVAGVGVVGSAQLGPDDLLLGVLGSWLLVLACLGGLEFRRPLSQPPRQGRNDLRAFLVILGLFAGVGVLTLAHGALTLVPGGALAGAAVAGFVLWRKRGALDRLKLVDAQAARVAPPRRRGATTKAST